MRVLFLSNTPFLPPVAGNRTRIAAMVDYLVDTGHEVAMLLLPAVDRAGWDVAGMRARLAWCEVAGEPARARGFWARRARASGRRAGTDAGPIGVDDWCPEWFRARARARVAAWKPDVVVVEYVFLSACLEGLAAVHPCVTVIDTQDLMHRRRAVYDAVGLPPQWFHTTYAEERRGLARADLVLAIQDEEAAVLREMVGPGRVLRVAHARPLRPAPLEAARPGRLLLVASYNDVNVRGLAWLCDSVWPALRTAIPDVELVVCGNIAEKLGRLPAGVIVRGFVPVLDAEYAAARVVVSPVPGGTGLKVKAVDALCHGRPVVATVAGAVGADVGEANGVLVAADAAEFAALVVDLLRDDGRWRRAVAGACTQAARRFVPDVVFAPLVAALAVRRVPAG